MVKLVAIASKQIQLQEVVACIKKFAVEDCRLYLFNYQGRVSLGDAALLVDEFCPHCRLTTSTFDINDRSAIADILAQDANVIAFPIYHSSSLYRKVPSLRRKNTIVHVTDGFGDLFTMWALRRAVFAKTKMALIKAALVVPLIYACRADLEFNLFYPQASPYSRRSLQAGNLLIASAKRQLLTDLLTRDRPEGLIVDGFGLKAQQIVAGSGLKSYVATKRDGGIIINGHSHLTNEIICAEEVLEVVRPSVVIGCPSTSLAAACHRYPGLPVFCIMSEEANRVRGGDFNRIFKEYGRRFGMSFVDADTIDEQLKQVASRLRVYHGESTSLNLPQPVQMT